jgi:protocatechuate 4,5-dioxygenase beta chain
MARLTAVLATTRHPYFHRTTRVTPPEDRSPQAAAWEEKAREFRATLTAARPDVLVTVGSDQFHQFFSDNYPTFLIGKQPVYDGTFIDEERAFDLPRRRFDGHEGLSAAIVQGLLDRGFDPSISHEWRLDHSFVGPLLAVRPQADLPVVPIHANTITPPLPGPRRFYELGRAIREIIDGYPSAVNVAAVGSGGLSLEIGGPR